MTDIDPRQAEHYPGFEGRVGKIFATSESAWPSRPTPPPGAPNIVIVLADDLGFSDVSCYGSEIHTPAIDALADAGIRYSNFHVTPLCSPTRAALLTGLNSHAAGMGFVANADPGFPGYASELPPHQPSLAEVLKVNGYATMALARLFIPGTAGHRVARHANLPSARSAWYHSTNRRRPSNRGTLLS